MPEGAEAPAEHHLRGLLRCWRCRACRANAERPRYGQHRRREIALNGLSRNRGKHKDVDRLDHGPVTVARGVTPERCKASSKLVLVQLREHRVTVRRELVR